jgi:3-hydroxyisobutyrate dehydrogenase
MAEDKTAPTQMAAPAKRIGVVGLGRMGRAIASALSTAGCSILGWSRSGISQKEAAELGIATRDDLAGLTAGCDIIILSLLDDSAVGDILQKLALCDLAGKLIVDTSTVSPGILRERIEAIRTAGGSAIDAPISGGPDTLRARTAGFYIGGDAQDFARFLPCANILSNRVVHVGPLGHGAAAKIVNNMMLAGFWQTLKEALSVGKRSGLTLETIFEILSKSPAANQAMLQRAPIILGQSDAVGFSVAGVTKDVRLYVRTASELGVDAPAVSAALASFIAHLDNGNADRDLATMVNAAYRSA